MKWTELQNIIVSKMSTLDDIDDYKENILILANECLVLIANAIKPCVKKATYNIFSKDVGVSQRLPDDFLTYSDYGHCRWYLPNYNEPYIICHEFPDVYKNDVLYVRISDCKGVKYHDGELIEERDDVDVVRDDTVNILYTGEQEFILNKIGTYEIQYEGLYPEITSPDQEIDVPRQILNVIPYYVAGDLLWDEDPSRAVQYKNTFETMAQRLNTNDYMKFTKPINNGGWY